MRLRTLQHTQEAAGHEENSAVGRGVMVPEACVSMAVGGPVAAIDSARLVEDLLAPQRKIDSPEFKAWFGSSVVVEEGGEPRVVYHGTNQPFSIFDDSRLGENTSAASSIAFFFSECHEEATEYACLASRTQVADAVNHEMLVEDLLRRIKEAEGRRDWDSAERLYLEMESADLGAVNADPSGMNIMPVYLKAERVRVLDMGDSFDGHVVAREILAAKAAGFDGVKLENVWDPVGLGSRGENGRSTTQWVVFDSRQIKSAIGNVGSFNSADPDITR